MDQLRSMARLLGQGQLAQVSSMEARAVFLGPVTFSFRTYFTRV